MKAGLLETTEWTQDVEVESTPLSTTGGHTWAAARRLAEYLGAVAAPLGLLRPGVRLLELGAGTGWLGVTVARNLHPSALVCLTEQEGGLAWLAHNVELNRRRGLPLGGVRVQACDWRLFCDIPDSAADGSGASNDGGSVAGGGAAAAAPAAAAEQQQAAEQQPTSGADPPPAAATAAAAPHGAPDAPLDLQAQRWDFIIGSDLIYNEIGSRCLPRVLAALAAAGGGGGGGGGRTTILYCHTKHRYDLLDIEFLEQLGKCGLEWEEVREPGAAPPPSSPPLQFPPVDLFPEQRIAVFRIWPAGQQQRRQ